MFLSVFTDELAMDFYEALPLLKEWGMKYVDFRGRINGKPIENLTDEEIVLKIKAPGGRAALDYLIHIFE